MSISAFIRVGVVGLGLTHANIVTALAQDQCGSPPQPPDGFSWQCRYPDGCHFTCHLVRMDPVENACRAAGSVLELEIRCSSSGLTCPVYPSA